MITSIPEILKRTAKDVEEKVDPTLDDKDKEILKKDGPRYMRLVQTNLKIGKKPLADMSHTGMMVLLAYVVFLRQNITTSKGDRPNVEDAAQIMHGNVYSDTDKDKKKLEEQLIKQLSKIGVDVDKNDDKGE